jgi:hypothetical protein
MAFGLAILIWGVQINGEHWWRRIPIFKVPHAPRVSPIAVSDVLYVDCQEVTDPLGAAKIDDLYSVAVCLQVENKAKDGRTIRGLTATIHDIGIHRTRLHIRKSANDVVDMRHGELELVELGRMLVAAQPGSTPAMIQVGAGKRREDLAEINYAFNPAQPARKMMISGDAPYGVAMMNGPSGSPITVTFSATDEPSKDVVIMFNLWGANPYEWVQVAKEVDA